VTFRHHQNASLNGEDQAELGTEGSLKTFYAYKNTFRNDHVWLEIPPNGWPSRITPLTAC
jgi:hypothetical protein